MSLLAFLRRVNASAWSQTVGIVALAHLVRPFWLRVCMPGSVWSKSFHRTRIAYRLAARSVKLTSSRRRLGSPFASGKFTGSIFPPCPPFCLSLAWLS